MRRRRPWRLKPRLKSHAGYLECLRWSSTRECQTTVELMECRASRAAAAPEEGMTPREAAKRAERITMAKLEVKRADALLRLRPYPSEERKLIRDLRAALQDLLEEVAQ